MESRLVWKEVALRQHRREEKRMGGRRHRSQEERGKELGGGQLGFGDKMGWR